MAGVINTTGIANYLLYYPYDLLIDSLNTLYISDQNNHRIQKWAFGASYGTTIAGNPNGTRGITLNRLNYPCDIIMDPNGGIYVAEHHNHRVTYWSLGASSGIIVAGNGKKIYQIY